MITHRFDSGNWSNCTKYNANFVENRRKKERKRTGGLPFPGSRGGRPPWSSAFIFSSQYYRSERMTFRQAQSTFAAMGEQVAAPEPPSSTTMMKARGN